MRKKKMTHIKQKASAKALRQSVTNSGHRRKVSAIEVLGQRKGTGSKSGAF